MILEFTHDSPRVLDINRERLANAKADLKRWLAGDHTPNNTYR